LPVRPSFRCSSLELVDLIPGEGARGRRPGPGRGERDVAVAGPGLELVETGFTAGAGQDGEPEEPRRGGGEAVFVDLGLDRRTPFRNGPGLEGGSLRHERLQTLLQVAHPALEPLQRFDPLRWLGQRAFPVLDAREDRRHGVILGVLDGVELVGVASGTAQGQPQEGRAGGADHVVDLVGALHRRQRDVGALDDVHRAGHEEPGGHVDPQGVAGDLLAQEAVVGLVGVEGLDDVVAEAPGAQPLPVGLEAVALGEADHVEPMAPPALAVAGVLEHAIHEALEGPGPRVDQERRDLFGRRRDPQHDEVESPDQGGRVRLGRWLQALPGQPLPDEGVDRVGRRRKTRRPDRDGHRGPHHRLEGPVRRWWRRRLTLG